MIRSVLYLLLGVSLSFSVSAHTLLIDAKKSGQTQMRIEHLYVESAGYNSLGVYIIRFYDGHEISLGKRSHWEKFEPRYVDDYNNLSH